MHGHKNKIMQLDRILTANIIHFICYGWTFCHITYIYLITLRIQWIIYVHIKSEIGSTFVLIT
jgi:hypothetical protein